MKLNFIDLFAGAGGLSEGFTACGYHPVAHVEMNLDACLSLKTRAAYYYLKEENELNHYYDYLKGVISRDELYSMIPDSILNSVINEAMSIDKMPGLFEIINSLMEEQNVKKIDLIVGGPPCQAYSLVGRARKGEEMNSDPRNYLYRVYLQVLKQYKPALFVFENVPGLLNANKGEYFADMRKEFEKAGYELDYKILNANTFGVLQNRRRVILIGWLKGLDIHYPEFKDTTLHYEVNDIFSDLPFLNPGETRNEYKDRDYSEYLKLTGIRSTEDVLTWHTCRPNIDRDRAIYRAAIELWDKEEKRLKYTDLPADLCTHKNRKGFLDRFKVVSANRPSSHTMMAHIAKDGHYFIHPDINQARSISVREAARIQSFPDNYFFEGSRTSAFTQIGNAVPPLMAKGIALELKNLLETINE